VEYRRLLALTALGGWLGCIGNIGTPSPEGEHAGSGLPLAAAPMHRLNRSEYRNTLRDLLGTGLDPAADFPADDISLGFDNIASILTVSPLQVELYEQAARELAVEALTIPANAATQHFEAEALTGTVGSATGSAWNLFSNGEVSSQVTLDGDGDYVIRARVWGQQAGPDVVKAAISVDAQVVGNFDVASDQNAPEVITANATLTGGTKTVSVAFLNDYYQAPADRNLYVDWIEVEGPLGVTGQNPIREKIVFCDPVDPTCRHDILSGFAAQAWRRPVTEEELGRLEALVQKAIGQGDTIEKGLELAVTGILLAPQFIYRPELDDDPTSEFPHDLDDYELASRLSYFLWSSMPDQELFDAASLGELQDAAGLRATVDRMLADPKAGALVDNFAGQWLLVRALEDHVPDYATYPTYDDTLRDSLREEMRLYFTEFLQGNVPLNKILTAEFTYVNDRLAEHYGLPLPGTGELQRVDLQGSPERFGLLTMGSLLTVTSYPNRTSPVKRGVWILEKLLCDGPPPPPPGVEGLKPEETPTGSLRERLEAHRSDPKCAVCHQIMDPLGFGLEHYDGIGAYRTEDVGGFPIDSKGEYFDKGSFDGAQQMADFVQQDPRFATCLVEKLFTYALGRDVESEDIPHLQFISEQLSASGYMMPELIKLLVTSEPFRMRRGTKEEVTP